MFSENVFDLIKFIYYINYIYYIFATWGRSKIGSEKLQLESVALSRGAYIILMFLLSKTHWLSKDSFSRHRKAKSWFPDNNTNKIRARGKTDQYNMNIEVLLVSCGNWQ